MTMPTNDADRSIPQQQPPFDGQADCTHIALTVTGEYSGRAFAQGSDCLAVVHFQAPDLPDAQLQGGATRAPVSLSAVIDRSGSMVGEKLELVRATLQYAVENLTERDELGVVSFSDTVREDLPLTRMTAEGKATAVRCIGRITASGGTNLSGGLFAGINQQSGERDPSANRDASPYPTHRRPTAAAPRYGTPRFAAAAAGGLLPQIEPWQVPLDGGHCEPTVECAPPGSAEADTQHRESRVQRATPPAAVAAGGPAGGSGSRRERRQQQSAAMRAFLLCIHRGGDKASPFLTDTAWSVFSHLRDYTVASVLLFTDGQATTGLCNTAAITAEAHKLLAPMGRDACTIHTFGFGAGHNEQLLRGIAEATGSNGTSGSSGGGSYYFVESAESIPTAFSECIGGLMSVVAQNLTVSLEALPDDEAEGDAPRAAALCTVARLCTKFPHSVAPDGRSATVTLRDLYSEEKRDIVALLKLPALVAPLPSPVPTLRCRLGYFNVLTNRQETSTCLLSISRPSRDATSAVPAIVDQQRNRLTCAAALEEARELSDQQRFGQARITLEKAQQAIAASPTASDPYVVSLLADLRECQERTGADSGSKMMSCRSMAHSAQRSSGLSEVYRNKAMRCFVAQSPCNSSSPAFQPQPAVQLAAQVPVSAKDELMRRPNSRWRGPVAAQSPRYVQVSDDEGEDESSRVPVELPRRRPTSGNPPPGDDPSPKRQRNARGPDGDVPKKDG